MKRLLIIAFGLVTTACINNAQEKASTTADSTEVAQQAEQKYKEMTFLGIPLTGSPTEFGKKLQSKGFTPLQKMSGGNYYSCSGTFAGRQVKLGVTCTPKTNIVYEVLVMYDKHKTWKELLADYHKVSGQLTDKYKKQAKNVLEHSDFLTPHYPNNDAEKMSALRDGYADFTIWIALDDSEKGNGEIIATIRPQGFVGVSYTDTYGGFLNAREEQEIEEQEAADY